MTTIMTSAETVATAQTAKADLETKISAAKETLRQATAHKNTLIQKSWSGQNVPGKALKEATDRVNEANDALAFLNDHVPLADAALAAATAAHVEVMQAEHDAAFAVAVRELITSADELHAAGAALATAGARYFARYEAVILAKSATGTTPSEADQAGYISARSRIKSVIPADIQYAIILQGSPVFVDVSSLERSHWGRFAAPDPKADESFNRRDAEAREKIGREQAFVAQGRADNERNSAWVDSWHPTQMHGNDAWHASRAAAMKVSEV